MKKRTFHSYRIVLIIMYLSLFLSSVSGQETMARLVDGLDSVGLTINDRVLATVYKDEVFMTFEYEGEDFTYWPVWTKTGKYGWTPKEKLLLLREEKIAKMQTDTVSLFRMVCNDFVNEDFIKYYSINYCKLVQEAALGSEDALLQILTMDTMLDGHAVETNWEVSWNVLNLWTDTEFYGFLTRQTEEDGKLIASYLVNTPVSWPITDYEFYYEEYYPKSWTILKAYVRKEETD